MIVREPVARHAGRVVVGQTHQHVDCFRWIMGRVEGIDARKKYPQCVHGRRRITWSPLRSDSVAGGKHADPSNVIPMHPFQCFFLPRPIQQVRRVDTDGSYRYTSGIEDLPADDGGEIR